MLYSQAKSLLLEELGLKDFEAREDLFSITNLSDVKLAHRMDAEYFQTKYKKLLSYFNKFHTDKLSQIAKRKTKTEKINKEEKYKYTEISNVNISSGEIKYSVFQGSELPANAKIKIEGGELLISKVRPTRGAIAIIPDGWNSNFIVSGAFSVFEVNSPIKEYLFVALKSIVGKLQLERPTTGTSYPTVTDKDVEDLIIPILPKPTQQKIADLVKKSHEARIKAKKLLGEAKKKVEEMIEKNNF